MIRLLLVIASALFVCLELMNVTQGWLIELYSCLRGQNERCDFLFVCLFVRVVVVLKLIGFGRIYCDWLFVCFFICLRV